MQNLFLTTELSEQTTDLNNIELLNEHAFKLIGIIRDQYLGPVGDVDILEHEFEIWKLRRKEIINLLRDGEITEAVSRSKSTGISEPQAEVVLSSLDKISLFADDKADALYATFKCWRKR